MKIEILGDRNTEACRLAHRLLTDLGHKILYKPDAPDIAIAPLLTEKIPAEMLLRPLHGTLIFHPSPLPYGRGASSLRWAYRRGEPITAATWFWANEKLDAGDICEQEIIKIDYDLHPREFYEKHVLPAMIRTLERALKGVQRGFKRRVKQIEEYSTYDGKIE
jgi:methionyl-tRNA formyltransferase